MAIELTAAEKARAWDEAAELVLAGLRWGSARVRPRVRDHVVSSVVPSLRRRAEIIRRRKKRATTAKTAKTGRR